MTVESMIQAAKQSISEAGGDAEQLIPYYIGKAIVYALLAIALAIQSQKG